MLQKITRKVSKIEHCLEAVEFIHAECTLIQNRIEEERDRLADVASKQYLILRQVEFDKSITFSLHESLLDPAYFM
jgi:hypothetical protein